MVIKSMNTITKAAQRFHEVDMFRYCEQCGRCSSACPLTGIDDFNIRRIIRYVELELIDEIADSLKPWFCATCGKCEDACPNGVKILDITRILRALSFDKNILDEEVPCVKACPAGIDIPEYMRLISEGKNEQACELILEKVPFPGILGRICAHPCETACKRVEVNEPVSICATKRYAADNAEELPKSVFNVRADTGHKIAVIGAGPAGLTAAFYLKKIGHKVTIFEARDKPGGMMRYAIPYYRLPETVLDKEINRVLSVGIDFKPNTKLGDNLNAELLKEKGYEVVFIAVGAQLSKNIILKGLDLEGVLLGLDFLVQVSKEKNFKLKENIIVVGGGNVAIDVALTALRLGAKNVGLACLESREEMPASPKDIEMACEEGVNILYSWGPSRIIGDNGKVSCIELIQCSSVFNDKGDFNPVFNNTKKTVKTEQVILAVGQVSDTEFCKDFFFSDGHLIVKNDLIIVDINTQETDMRGVFAGGDVYSGPSTVVEAIASGRRAAISIDKYLGGDGIIYEPHKKSAELRCYDGKREVGFSELKRAKMHTLPLPERHDGLFVEIELGFSNEQAISEVKRCLQCDLEFCLAKENPCSK